MNLIHQIQDCIRTLNVLGCKDEDIIIAYSPLIEQHFIKNATSEMMMYVRPNEEWQLTKIQGISTYNKHPYNEIVIYDVKRCVFGDKFIIKIKPQL